MDEFLYYSYLKWHDENNDKALTKLKSLPTKGKILVWLLILSGILGFASVFINIELAQITIVIEIFICLMIFIYSERMCKNNSFCNYEEYKCYCDKLFILLNDYNITDRNQITEIRNRFIAKQAELQSNTNRRRDRIDTWMKVIIFPIIIIIINKSLDSQTNLNGIYAYATSALLLFISIYVFIVSIISICHIYETVRSIRYESIINDLQGLIDIKFGI